MKNDFTCTLFCGIVCSLVIIHQTSSLPITTRSLANEENVEREGNLFEGDIILSVPDQLSLLRRSYRNARQSRMTAEEEQDPRWPDGRIPYKMDTVIDPQTRTLFQDAIAEWTSATCISFHQATDNDTDYLLLSGNGCSSSVGRRGGPQTVRAGRNGCHFLGNAIHELGHAIGLWHEHTRQDRDEYIQIFWDRIDESGDYWKNFVIHDQPFVPDVRYDIGSIMHYGDRAFSHDGVEDTIGIVHPVPSCMNAGIMGQRKELSYKDKLRVNLMYNCSDQVAEMLQSIDDCLYTPLPDALTPTDAPTEPPTECKESKNIASGTHVRLQFYQELETPDPSNTVYCGQSTCRSRTNCMVDLSSSCSEERFEIRKEGKKNKFIKVGDRVEFRSLYRTSDWIRCSTEACRLSPCDSEDFCRENQLEILRENQQTSPRIQTKDKVYFKAIDVEEYLDCTGAVCRLVAECEGSGCGHRQYFSVTKESECSDS